ncbi:beta-L-arabinofuranosidase domain-containing protein [Kitasatospora paranensis]|uniref:beta-L-arabinofuranosidase domain-containing protein n=1 Tax=Kitasatospora paranensis TaxID=258053 RepID=UPI003CD0AF9D
MVTRDATALATARRWIEAILATQQSDGWFGPRALRTSLGGGPDFWPFLPLLQALRSWYEYTADSRILPFLTAFLRFMNAQGPGAFNQSWVSVRWGDGLDTVVWLYNRTRDAFLIDLMDTIHRNGANWTSSIPSWHNVNIAQGFREPAQYAQRSGLASDTSAAYRTYDTVLGQYGQFPGGGFAADESARPGFGDPRQGFETCGVVEFMASHELLNRLTGDPLWADRCEELAFNALPPALDPQGKAVHYITSPNSVDLDNVPKSQGQFQNGFAMQSYRPGVDQYRCCPHNYGMGWPWFTQELWLATPDAGLCAAMYAPCTVAAKVADGTTVTVTEETDYPFGDTVTLTVTTPRPVAFPLVLRIPGWCPDPQLTVNGQAVTAPAGPAYTTVRRTWNAGDRVVLRLPQRLAVRTWTANHRAVSVSRGPLDYALQIGESYVRTGGTDVFPEYDVHATTPWNYGLAVDPAAPTAALAFSARGGTLPANPFTQDGNPLRITAPARRIAEWQVDGQHVVSPLQDSPARSAAAVETVTLIPMAAARLRISAFPTASPDGTPGRWAAPRSGSATGTPARCWGWTRCPPRTRPGWCSSRTAGRTTTCGRWWTTATARTGSATGTPARCWGWTRCPPRTRPGWCSSRTTAPTTTCGRWWTTATARTGSATGTPARCWGWIRCPPPIPRRWCSSPTVAPTTTCGCSCRTGSCGSRTATRARCWGWIRCPPPIPRRWCSSPTAAPTTTSGRSSTTATAGSGSGTSTRARCWGWIRCPPPTPPGSCSSPTTGRTTTSGRSSTTVRAGSGSAMATPARCSAWTACRRRTRPGWCSSRTAAPPTTSGDCADR